MTNFTGILNAGPVTGIGVGEIGSAELRRCSGPAFGAYTQAFADTLRIGVKAGSALVSNEPMQQFGATLHEVGGQELFEKIVAMPRVKELGFVLADIVFNVNVWNTHRASFRTCLRVDFQDSGNVLIDNPLGWPLSFGPFQGRDFTATVPRDGDATINARVIFVFPGESGADLALTGSRIVVFGAVDIDWSESPRERTQYLTDILRGYSGKEQRMALRSAPRTQFSFRTMTQSRLESAALDALIWGWQGRIYGVPFWPDAQALAETVTAGSTAINCDTNTRKYKAGGLVVLWRDFMSSEAAQILSVASGGITVTAPINNTWPADGRTYVAPALMGRLSDPELRRLNNQIAEADLVFQCEEI